MVQLRRTAANAAAYDLECEVVTPERAQELWPPMQVDDLLGALWLPGDGKVNPTDLTQSLAKGARQGGARVRRGGAGDRLRRPRRRRGRGSPGVRTDQGDGRVRGGRQLRRAVGEGARRPGRGHRAAALAPSTSTSSPRRSTGTHPDLPIMRDPDGWTYFKEEVGGLVVGGFEPEAKPWRSPDDLPYPFEFQLLEEDWEHFSVADGRGGAPHPGAGGDRDPEVLQRPGVVHAGQPVPARARRRGSAATSWAPASTRSASRPRAAPGRALAEWIVAGEPTGRPGRRSTYAGSRRSTVTTRWLRSRVAEILGLHYAVPWPNREPETARDRQRLSPLHERLAAAGRVFGCRMGWERPQRVRAAPGAGRAVLLGQAVLAAVVRGRAARDPRARSRSSTRRRSPSTSSPARTRSSALQWVCAADVDVPVGRLRLHAVPQRARHLRGRPHRHPHRRRTRFLARLAAPRPRSATSTGSADTGPGVPTSRSTSPTSSPCSG